MEIKELEELNLKSYISGGLESLFKYKSEPHLIELQKTRKEFEGSYTFVVFPYTRFSGKSPEDTAKALGNYLLQKTTLLSSFNVVKGFLNLVLTDEVWKQLVSVAINNPTYGRAQPNGNKVMVEYSSPNTNKPLHLGHLRNIFLGDATSRILQYAGFEVMQTSLVNDRGIHICKSMLAYQLYGHGETPESSGIKGDHLVGKYYVKFDQENRKQIARLMEGGMDEDLAKKETELIKQAQKMLLKWEEKDKDTVDLWRKMNQWVYDGFGETYSKIGIQFDKMYYESETYLLGKDLIEEGLASGVFYQKEDRSVWIDLTEEGLDHKLVRRSDGTSVYITQDLGTCELKYKDFPFTKSVYVVGNEQDYHFQVLFTIMKKLGRDYYPGLFHLSYGMVDLPSGKMKSREGTVVDADDLLKEMVETAEKHTIELGKIENLSDEEAKALYNTIGIGALKYFLLKVDPKKRMLFNPEESIEFQGHTGPFIQYTFARISAILRRASALDLEPSKETSEPLIKREKELISRIVEFPRVVQEAAHSFSPALVAQYIYELAKEYNGFYQEITIFNNSNKELVEWRIGLSMATSQIIQNGMNILGIPVPNRM